VASIVVEEDVEALRNCLARCVSLQAEIDSGLRETVEIFSAFEGAVRRYSAMPALGGSAITLPGLATTLTQQASDAPGHSPAPPPTRPRSDK
jgi:hypothetical protein